jgi:hypothetical protein
MGAQQEIVQRFYDGFGEATSTPRLPSSPRRFE